MLLRGQPGRLPGCFYGEQGNLTVLRAAVSQKVRTMFIRSSDWGVTVEQISFPVRPTPGQESNCLGVSLTKAATLLPNTTVLSATWTVTTPRYGATSRTVTSVPGTNFDLAK